MVKVGVKAFQSWIWVDRALNLFHFILYIFFFPPMFAVAGRKQRGSCQGFIDVLR